MANPHFRKLSMPGALEADPTAEPAKPRDYISVKPAAKYNPGQSLLTAAGVVVSTQQSGGSFDNYGVTSVTAAQMAQQYLEDIEENPVWQTKDGTRIRMRDMGDGHIVNAITMLQNKGYQPCDREEFESESYDFLDTYSSAKEEAERFFGHKLWQLQQELARRANAAAKVIAAARNEETAKLREVWKAARELGKYRKSK